MSDRFAGRHAVVTGAASDLGRAVVQRLDSEGATVLGLDAADATDAPVEHRVVDVSDPAAIDALVGFEPDILVNAARIRRQWAFLEHPNDDWRATLDVNLGAAVRLSRAFARQCLDRQAAGVILNVTSSEACRTRPGQAAFTASQAGLIMLTKAFALELAEHHIRVVAVAPGAPGPPAGIPMGRRGLPEETAGAIAFLASDEASYLTGVVLPVDGGWLTERGSVAPTGRRIG
jgi:NAD(P)-dependent dehydrogenase (short-subunit alcohol dehydrogenase family)